MQKRDRTIHGGRAKDEYKTRSDQDSSDTVLYQIDGDL